MKPLSTTTGLHEPCQLREAPLTTPAEDLLDQGKRRVGREPSQGLAEETRHDFDDVPQLADHDVAAKSIEETPLSGREP
jgi:hypothetical protein